MASRFPTPSGEASLRDVVSSALDVLHHGPAPFEHEDANGQLIGCYASMPYTPHIAPAAFSLMQTIYTPATLPARLRQLGILAVASVYKAPYVLYCHTPVSEKLGFSEQQFRDAVDGVTPQSLSDSESVAFETALKLARDRHALSDEDFARAETVLGKEGVAGLANVVAGYVYVCILVNVAGPRPGGWEQGSEQREAEKKV
ncbi:AhpD-like protein [Pyrenochaeta sp. MPI-SDFR-AT-0127]|nr:AhpD-like protein [Pyrenochaeta sp. MPI-SDFR-AT-0127]